MAPKKQKPNAFAMFAQELSGKQGRKYASFKDACDAAAPMWANMSKHQKRPYEERAKGSREGIFTSQGRNVEELTKEQEEATAAENKANTYIKNHLETVRDQRELANETFLLIDANIFCYHQKNNEYFPAEIAVSCFSLRDGVLEENIFHRMVNPGALPIGYKFDAIQHSTQTHLIELPKEDEDNTEDVYYSLKYFLEEKKPAGTKLPILYAEAKYRNVIKTILNRWSEYYDGKDELCKVYSLEFMFYMLRNTVSAGTVWVTDTFSSHEIEKDVFAYTNDIACSYHSTAGKPVFCSKSRVTRYAYIICTNCCSDLGLELIEGRHVPLTFTTSSGSVSGRCGSSRSSQISSKGSYQNLYPSSDTTYTDTDRESVVSFQSEASTIQNFDFDEEFPTLGGRPRYTSQSSNASQEPLRSYAGAANRSNISDAFSNLSINQKTSRGAVAGFRAANPHDSDSEQPSAFASFPSLQQQSRGRGVRKLNNAPKPPGKF